MSFQSFSPTSSLNFGNLLADGICSLQQLSVTVVTKKITLGIRKQPLPRKVETILRQAACCVFTATRIRLDVEYLLRRPVDICQVPGLIVDVATAIPFSRSIWSNSFRGKALQLASVYHVTIPTVYKPLYFFLKPYIS